MSSQWSDEIFKVLWSIHKLVKDSSKKFFLTPLSLECFEPNGKGKLVFEYIQNSYLP